MSKALRKLKLNGGKVKRMRRAYGLNQQQFWSRIGVTQSGGSRYEAGRSIPLPVQALVTIAYDAVRSAGVLEAIRP